jgi:hypothetical protein
MPYKYHSTYRQSFVKHLGHFSCQNAGLFETISEQQGFPCVCRDPRCSFRCQQNHGKKESQIIQEYALAHFQTKLWFKGCLKLKPEATQEDHNRACKYFNALIRDSAKADGITIKFRGRYHATGFFDKHLDYVAWSDCKDLKKIQSIWYACAKRAGFLNYACKPIFTREQLRGWCDYMFRRYTDPKKERRFVYLLAEDGTAIIRGSQHFFEGTTYEKLWDQIKQRISSNVVPSNKELNTHQKLSNIHEILDSNLPLEDKVLLLLPQQKDEAILPGKFLWLMGVEPWLLVEIIYANPLIRWNKLRIYYDNPCPEDESWEERLFGSYGIPYHSTWFPHPIDCDKEIRRIIKAYEQDVWLTEEEFMSELMV